MRADRHGSPRAARSREMSRVPRSLAVFMLGGSRSEPKGIGDARKSSVACVLSRGADVSDFGEEHGALAVRVDTWLHVCAGVAGDCLRGCPDRAGESPRDAPDDVSGSL